MELRIIYGKAGTGKSKFCYDEIQNIIKKEKKIYIITPEQFSFTAEKKLMSIVENGAAFNAEVITFGRMAYRILNEVGGAANAQLSKSGKAMLVYSILNNKKSGLKFLSKSDENIEICLNAINEFKKHGISTEMLKNEIDNQEDKYLQTKLIDLNTIYEGFENQIKEQYIDESDLLTILAQNLNKTEMFKNSIIYIDEFAGFTSQERDVISELLKIAKSITITVCADNLNANTDPEADIFYSNKKAITKIIDLVENQKDVKKINLNSAKRFKTEELKHLEENLYAPLYKKYNKEPKNIELFLAKNPYTEIENVAKNITKKVRDENYRYNDIAIITKNLDTYSSTIRAIFAKYEIPVFVDEKRTLGQNIVIQYVLSIIDVLNKNWQHEAMFNYIKSGFLELDAEEIFKLENYCLKWGIKYNKWTKDFAYGLNEEKDKQEIQRLNEIRKQIINPLTALKETINKQKTAENISKELYKFITNQKIEEKLQRKIENLESLGLIDLASEYKESYKIFINILDEMILVFKDQKITFEKYVNTLKVGFKNSGLGKIPQVADQVTVGDVDRSRSHKVKKIYIIGLNDGVFPSVNKDEGFLNDSDREALKKDGIELAKGTIEKLYEDNFNIYKAFTTAEENLYLSYASSDQEGKTLRPSILIYKLKRIFPNLTEKSDVITESQEILTQNTTYDELITNINKLKCGEKINNIWYNVYNYYKNSPKWNAKLQSNLAGLEYTNMPKQINNKNISKLYGNTLNTSISRLEKYRSCPFSYYLQYGLKLKEREELKVQSINTGTFMHETIDKFFTKVREEKINLTDLDDEKIKEIVNKIIDEELSFSKNYIFTSTAKYKLLVLRLKRLVAKSLKYIVETLVQSQFNVLGTEVEFSKKR